MATQSNASLMKRDAKDISRCSEEREFEQGARRQKVGHALQHDYSGNPVGKLRASRNRKL
jgi:hypothetical protein